MIVTTFGSKMYKANFSPPQLSCRTLFVLLMFLIKKNFFIDCKISLSVGKWLIIKKGLLLFIYLTIAVIQIVLDTFCTHFNGEQKGFFYIFDKPPETT